jgi:type II restriction/modification system DNA methylase subunit YeeA
MPSNPNGRTNAEVLRPSWIGIDVARRPRDVWIIDFTGLTEVEASFFSAPFAYVTENVKPLRDKNARDTRRLRWWLHGDAQPRMRAAIKPLPQCIVTAEVSKHRTFVWAPKPVLPDCKLMVVARDDNTSFGILHSRFHELWALATGSWHGVGNDPRYTPSTTFETFPFPDGLTPDRRATDYAADPRAQAIAQAAVTLMTARARWLNPPELVEGVARGGRGIPRSSNAKGRGVGRRAARTHTHRTLQSTRQA